MSVGTGTLIEDLEESLAKEMQKTMDYGILCDVMVRFGWTVVKTEYKGGQPWVDVVDWASKNLTGKYQEHNGVWLIEEPEDAVMFKLKWV